MSTILSTSVLNIVQSFSPEDMAAFIAEFEKLQKPVANCKPKRIKPKTIFPTFENCMQYVREIHSIQAQGKLA
ncbi:hypothetical protein ACM55F_10145 [Flavobacterium sp. XS2P12]|uniref:hypothetical protein n=1 Tax=Flavobacterium melibiosi TaxID=3398734 RepID=UPI003A837F93